jgi:sigma-54 specific flagellar transcriptional regulator A
MSTHWNFPGLDPDPDRTTLDRMLPGEAPAMSRLKRLVQAVAPSAAPVLVHGPSGAGKELVAQAIHRLSGRTGALVAVNCAAIPADLLEGELFGRERGAFTGADQARAGLIEQAAGGTLFLDEIGDMPLALQAKLLRVLETREVRRLGASGLTKVDFRLVAATHRDLGAVVAAGAFREDLYFRLAVFPVLVPSLAERASDIPLLVKRLMDEHAATVPAARLPEFDAPALRALGCHAWPGNVRELKTVVQRACLLFPGQTVSAQQVSANLLRFAMPEDPAARPATPQPMPLRGEEATVADSLRRTLTERGRLDLRGILRDIEVALIDEALQRSGTCVSHAAIALGLHRTTLIEKMRKHGMMRG